MSNVAAPFRAEHVGSLLRPKGLKDARRAVEESNLDAIGLRRIEDEHIVHAIRKQEEVGLQAITDGEFRRSWWHLDFLEGFQGVEKYEMTGGMAFSGTATKAEGVRVVDRIAYVDHPMLDHFAFLKANTTRTAKFTLPAPSALYGRRGREAISTAVYPDIDSFWADLGDAYRKAVNAFVAAGCRYIQLDEVYLILLADAKYRADMEAKGEDSVRLAETFGDLINAALADVPADVTTAMHLCRGNFKSTFLGSGAYDAVARILFDRIKIDGYFMEYDTERAGGFEPLANLPNDRRVVLGLVSSKLGQVEDTAAIVDRIEQASSFANIDQLCLSPQCGFASTEEGNLVAEDAQWRKLKLVVDTAEQVWG